MRIRLWKCCTWSMPLSLLAAIVTAGEPGFAVVRPPQPKVKAVAREVTQEDWFDTRTTPTSQEVAKESPSRLLVPPQTPGCCDILYPGSESNPNSPPNAAPSDQSFGSLSAGQGLLTAQSDVAASLMPGGYLDPAAPVTTFRLRYDIAIDNRFPDRGEYFYAKCGCFNQSNAHGPNGGNTSVDSQEIRPYFEYALNPRFSVFTELPVRFVNFHSLPDTGGLGREGGFADMNVGFKYALIAEADEYLTFQSRTYIPTGDSSRGLGTHHVSVEPSLLYYKRLSNTWLLQGQVSSFNPISVSSFASNVIEYGAGLGYLLRQGESLSVMPTLEAVGWTFLGGQKFSPVANGGNPSSASGDTIVNIKPGVRIGLGETDGPMMFQRHTIYAGFGLPITGSRFYSNLFRVEYRVLF